MPFTYNIKIEMAEGVGFEPTVLSHNEFQARRNNPLCQPSISIEVLAAPKGLEPLTKWLKTTLSTIEIQGSILLQYLLWSR